MKLWPLIVLAVLPALLPASARAENTCDVLVFEEGCRAQCQKEQRAKCRAWKKIRIRWQKKRHLHLKEWELQHTLIHRRQVRGLPLVLQAALGDGLAFDPFSLQQDCLAASEVDVGRG